MCLLPYRKREKEHGYGEESCGTRRFLFALPNCKPPPLVPARWSSPVVVVVPWVIPSCIFASVLQDGAAAPPVSVRIIVCNAHANVFSCKFSCISGGAGHSLRLLASLGSSRRRRSSSARWSSSAAAAAGGCRPSAVRPGTLTAGRLLFPPLSAALFWSSGSPAGGLCSALLLSLSGCPAGVFGGRFCSAGDGCIQ